MVHPYGDHVLAAELDRRRQIAGERAVAVWSLSNLLAVAPDGAVIHDAVKSNPDRLILLIRRKRERLAIPSSSTRQERRATGQLGIKRSLDAPVMRQIDCPPIRVIKSGFASFAIIAFEKFPVPGEQPF